MYDLPNWPLANRKFHDEDVCITSTTPSNNTVGSTKERKKCCFLHPFFTINEPPSVKCQTLLGKGSLKSEAYYPLAHFQWPLISTIFVDIT